MNLWSSLLSLPAPVPTPSTMSDEVTGWNCAAELTMIFKLLVMCVLLLLVAAELLKPRSPPLLTALFFRRPEGLNAS